MDMNMKNISLNFCVYTCLKKFHTYETLLGYFSNSMITSIGICFEMYLGQSE